MGGGGWPFGGETQICWGRGRGGAVYWEEISLGGRNEQIDSAASRPQFLEGDCWGKGVTLFTGVCSFYIKNKLKSELFNNKKRI